MDVTVLHRQYAGRTTQPCALQEEGQMIQKILAGTDVSTEAPEDAGLHRAARLARAHGAELVVVGLTPAPDPRQLLDPDTLPQPDGQLRRIKRRSRCWRGAAARTAPAGASHGSPWPWSAACSRW